MNKPQRNFNRLLSVILASLLTAAAAVPSVYAVPGIVYPDGTNCVLVSDDDAKFNVEKADIDGNIYAHDNIRFYGSDSVKVEGFASSHGSISKGITASKTDDNIYSVPDFSASIERNTKYAKTFESDIEISETELDITDNIYVSGNLELDEVKLKAQGYITAENTIKCHLVQDKDTDNECTVFYSKNGDIIINGSELTINGIIYAPNGKVIFNVKKLTVNGGIYAEDVEFNGTELSLNKTEEYDDLVTDKLTIEAGEDREIYIGESLELEGSSNYENVSYKWSSDESVSFEDANSQKTLAAFSKVGTYKVKLTGTLNKMFGSDTLTVKVNPDPSKTFTTTDDFSSGKLNNTLAKDNSLSLAKENKTVSEINKSYISQGVSGINVESTVSKDKITSQSDKLGITYDLKGVGSTTSVDEQGVDFVFAIDNSGSMYGEYLRNAQEAAKTILTYMHEGDRYAITDLGKLHIGFTDDKELLEAEIDKVGSGSGSSEMGTGMEIANKLFAESSSENRQKYILLLTDGENFQHSLEQLHEIAEDSAEKNIKIFSLAMHNEMQNLQDVAIITKGIYKHCPDAETIKTFMERFGSEIFNSAARNVLFKTTVTDINKIDLENISPAPSEITENSDGSAEISWSISTFEIDQTESIYIPVKSDLFAESGYERLTYNTALYYNDKEGKGQKTYLDDVTLPCDTYSDSGTWSAVYDSQRENCQWTGIYWNGTYPSDTSADIYISVSNDGINYTADKKVVNYTVPENLKGRYIRVRADLKKGSDGSSPVIDDITVISGTMSLSEPFESAVSAKVDANSNVYANRPITLYSDIAGNSDSIKDISWTVSGTEKYNLDTSNILMPTVTFEESGKYTITLKVSDDSGKYAESTFNIDVMEQENVSDIIFDDGTDYAPVKYTVEGEFKYFSPSEKSIHLVTDNPSAISWVSVRFISDYNNRIYIYSIDEELNSTFRIPYYWSDSGKTGKMEITAYDWSGNPYKYEFDIICDSIAPEINLVKPESKYPNGRFYTEDPYTISVTVTDNYEIDYIKLYVDDEEAALDENNSYTFTPTEDKRYDFKAVAFDKAGNSRTVSGYNYIYKDTSLPNFNTFKLNRYTASIGNEIIFTATAYDNETGLKSVVYTVNEEEISLDENGEYKYIASEAGEFIFKGVAGDNRGNIREQTGKLTVTEDTQRPSVSISATRSREILAGTSAVVTVTATDNVAVTKIDVDVNGKEYSLDENNQFTLKAEKAGDITITATAYDNVGNSSKATYILKAIDEDTASPSVSISVSNRYEYLDRNETLNVSSRDNTKVSSRKLYLDGKELGPAETRYSNPEYSYTDYYTFNPSVIGAGEHTVKAVTTDESGNKTELEKVFTVSDTYAPSVSFEGGTYFNTNDNVVITLKVADNTEIDSITGTLNDKPLDLKDVSEQNLTIENADAGTYVFSVTAKDIYGNEKTNTKTITVRDTQKPVITLSDVAEEYFIPDKPVIRMTVTDNVEVSSVTVKMNNEELVYDGKKIVLPETLEEGDYEITVTAKDTSNNTSTEKIKFKVSIPKDTTPPVIESISIFPENAEIGVPIQVYVTASDDSGSVEIEVSTNGTKFTYEDGAYTYIPQTAGEISVTIKAADPSGNVSEINAEGYVSEDATAPVVTADYQSSMTVNQTQTITVSATDNKSVLSLTLQMNETNVKLSDGKYVFTPSKAGEYKFTALAADSSGNIGRKDFTVEVTEKQDTSELGKYLVNKNETAVDDELLTFTNEYDTPVKVYNYAKNEIMPEFYGGSRKGASSVLAQGGGNDVDTASFMIAALRKLGYPARYAVGTVQYNEQELKALTGAEDINSAIQTLDASGYDSQAYYTPSGERLLQIKHTWVETYVPLIECGENSKESAWVTLDPWYKTCKIYEDAVEQDSSEINIGAERAKSILEKLTEIEKEVGTTESSAKLRNIMNDIVEESSQKNVYNIIYISESNIDALPKSAEFNIVNKSSVYADVPDSERDTISISVGGKQLSVMYTSDILSKNILLQYVPASENDKEIFEQADYNWKSAASKINAVPVITADGEELGKGSSVKPGTYQTLTISIKSGGTTKTLTDNIMAGNMYAIVSNLYDISDIDMQKVTDRMEAYVASDEPYGPYSEELLGSLLSYAGKMYYKLNDNYERLIAAKHNVNVISKISVGLFGYEFNTRENFYGNVTGLKDGSFITDIDEYTFYAVSRDGNSENRENYILNQSVMSSYFEGFIWEYITNSYGLSTMSVLAYSNHEGIDILNINSKNISDIYSLNLSAEVINDIKSHVEEGYTVIVPAKEVTIDDWTGTGYAMINYSNFEENIFRLSNTINGGGESIYISLDDIMVKSDDYKSGYKAVESGNSNSPDVIDRKEPLSKYNLPDGYYKLNGTILKEDLSGISRADAAVEKEVGLTVTNSEYILTLDLNSLTVSGVTGYASGLKYYLTGYKTDDKNRPIGTLKSASVISLQKDSKGNIISDERGTNYPDKVSFEMIPEGLTNGYVPICFDVIKSVSEGMTEYPAYLSLDWSTLCRQKQPNGSGGGNGSTGNSESGSGAGSGGNSSGGGEYDYKDYPGGFDDEYYSQAIDLEKLVNKVYRIRVMIATTRLANATVNMNSAAYSKPDISSMVGSCSGMFSAADEADYASKSLFKARTLFIDFYASPESQESIALQMLSDCDEEIKNFLDGFIDNSKSEAYDYLTDGIVDRMPNGLKKPANIANIVKKIYKLVDQINKDLSKLEQKD